LHRLTLIFGASNEIMENDLGALMSAQQRANLLRKSIEFTFTHPLLGVGMGQFAVAYTGDAEKKGEHAAYLGSHNSYTQVSSECGIPAFICYFSIIMITLSRSLRTYRRARGKPGLKDLEGMAFVLFATAITYSVATFFFHMAYTVLLPLLSGQATALYYVAEPVLREAESKPA
jgi:O-antigen ligase